MASGEMYFVEDPKSTCDIFINSDGTVPLVTGNQEIVQSLKDELESNMTQWYLGYSWGLKLLQDDGNGLLDKKSTNDEIQEEIQRVISKNTNITHSEILSIEKVDRAVNIEFIIQTVFDDETHKLSISI